MNIKRRRFLQGTAALFCAPAIVKADNLMKIWVPPQGITTPIMPAYSLTDPLGLINGRKLNKQWMFPDVRGMYINLLKLEGKTDYEINEILK